MCEFQPDGVDDFIATQFWSFGQYVMYLGDMSPKSYKIASTKCKKNIAIQQSWKRSLFLENTQPPIWASSNF